MRSRISIKGCVRPSVRRLIRWSAHHTRVEIMEKDPFFDKMKAENGKIHESMASKRTFKWYKYKIISTGAGTSMRKNASLVQPPFDLFAY